MFEKQLKRQLQPATDLLDCSAYSALARHGHPSVSRMLLQDALIKCAPEALVATFLQVDAEFLGKDVVRSSLSSSSIVLQCANHSHGIVYSSSCFVL